MRSLSLLCVLGLFLTNAYAQSFVLSDFLDSVVSGGTYQANDAVTFFDIMGQNQCFGSDKALFEIALSCLSQATTIISSSYCPPSCSKFYGVLAQNCPGIFEGVDLPLPYASGTPTETLAGICQSEGNPGPSPPTTDWDNIPTPTSCEAHFNQGIPPSCDTAISLSLNTGDNTCPPSCVPLWSTFPEQCKTDLYAQYAQYPGYLEYEASNTPPGYIGCLALALPNLFSGGVSPPLGTSPSVPPPDDGTGPDINEVETDGPVGPDTPGTDTIPTTNASPPPSTTLAPPPTESNTTGNVIQLDVTAVDVPACAAAISTGVFQTNVDSCLGALQVDSNTCPTACQQFLGSLTDQCKTELNALAAQQNVPLDLFSLSALCGAVNASIRISPAYAVAMVVALALAQLA